MTTINTREDVALSISPETVTLSLSFPTTAPTSLDEVLALLQEARVRHGIDHAAISDALARYGAGEEVKDLVIARQQDPTPTGPHSLRYSIKEGQIAAPGDLICELNPDHRLEAGRNVFGEPIEVAADLLPVLNGQGAIVDGGKVKASCFGVVHTNNNLISVVPPLVVAADKLSACLDIYGTSQLGTPIELSHLLDTLRDAGITHGIDEAAMLDALERAMASAEPQKNVVVGRGLRARVGTNVDYEFNFTLSGLDPRSLFSDKPVSEILPEPCLLDLVDGGALLCREIPAQPAINGKDLFGEETKAPPAPKSKIKAPMCGEHVERAEGSRDYLSTLAHPAYANFRDGKLYLIAPIRVSEDQMAAFLDLYPADSRGRMLRRADVNAWVDHLGITFGLDENAIQSAFDKVHDSGEPVRDCVIARGRPGQVGEDARLEFMLEVEQKVGNEKEDGTIDYRERGTIVNVKAGTAICKKLAPTPGNPQINVRGDALLSSPGKDKQFHPGEQVELRDDVFYAVSDGALLVKDDVVHVSDIYAVPSDVGLKTGNLFHKKGAIEIKGSVQSGFEVKANGHIMVKDNCENGKLVAGGDVWIGAGVIQPEDGDGYIHSIGSVSVKFAQNAKIYSYQNIIVNGSAMNCHLHAKGHIDVTKGKGCIIGGVVKACDFIKAKQLGSEAGALTSVEIEVDARRKKALMEEIEKEQEQVDRFGASSAKLLELHKELKDFYNEARQNAAIIAEGVIHPGVTLRILDSICKVTEEKRRCKVTLGADKSLVFEPLS